MAMNTEFARQIEQQIGVWQSQIRDYQEQMQRLGTEARANQEKAIEIMRQNVEQAGRLLTEAQGAQMEAWTAMQTASRHNFAQLQKAWAEALGRFGG